MGEVWKNYLWFWTTDDRSVEMFKSILIGNVAKTNLRVASSKPSLRLRLHASAVAWLFQRHELLPGNTNIFNVVSPWKLESDSDETTINIP